MKKISSFLIAALMILAVIVFPSCQSASKTSGTKMLKFNLEQGKGYDYEMIWDMDTKVAGQGSSITITGLYAMNITDITQDVRSISTAYKRIKMDMKVMGMEMSMDSEKPVPDDGDSTNNDNPLGMMNKVMGAIIGKEFIIKVDEEGKVLEVTGFERIMSDMIDSMGITGDAKAQAEASMKDQFSDQSIKDQFAQVFTIFPNKEVKVGDSWEKNYSTGGKMAAKYSTTYTVKEIEGDHVTLKSDTRIATREEGQEISGKMTGNIIVDSKTGLMINGEFDQDIEIKAGGQTVEVKGKGRIKGTAQ